ncbi:MAG: BlaI/MecI/CopY family transcriptional regulator, partial [Planctomycetota bacterium]
MGIKRPPLSKGETIVASSLSRLQSASLGEIHKEVNRIQDMEYSTVQSYIRRLIAKGYVKSKKNGRNNVYGLKGNPQRMVEQLLDQMLSQVFAGDAIPIFRHLIRERGISDSEMRELRNML